MMTSPHPANPAEPPAPPAVEEAVAVARSITDELWPVLGGDQAAAETWQSVSDALMRGIAPIVADRDRLRTFVRSARRIVQAYASEHPKIVLQGSYQGDPMGAHAWLAAESAEIGTARDGGDPKLETRT